MLQVANQSQSVRTQVTAWLRSLPNTSNVSPMTLKITNKAWDGAKYTQHGAERFYLVGKLPLSYQKSDRTCYQFVDDDTDYYIICYLEDFDALDSWQHKYHPFKESWVMKAWDQEEKIDEYEMKPYKRIHMAISS